MSDWTGSDHEDSGKENERFSDDEDFKQPAPKKARVQSSTKAAESF